MSEYYESDRGLSEYLLFHYGQAHEVLPWDFGPANGLYFPVRCVSELLDRKMLSEEAAALDVGCAVGRASFELARYCTRVLGVDASRQFIEAATRLAKAGYLDYGFVREGAVIEPGRATVPPEIERKRVTFQVGDAHALSLGGARFEVVLLANLVDRLREPRQCLAQLPGLVLPGGQLLITTPCTWLAEYTAPDQWLGGFQRQGRAVSTLETLRQLLEPAFELEERKDLPMLIREHARKYQWSVAEGTRWRRR